MNFTSKLRFKIIFGISVILGISLFGVAYQTIVEHRQQLLETLKVQGENLTKLLAKTSKGPIERFIFFRLQELVFEIEQFPEVAFCEINDPDGRSFLEEVVEIKEERFVKKTRQTGDDILIIEKPVLSGTELLGKVEIGFYLDGVRQKMRKKTGYLIAAFLGILGCVALILYAFLSHFFVSPVVRLSKTAKILAEGEFITTDIAQRKDEIGLLGKSFNHMSRNLKNLYQKLEEYNVHLEKKVRQRTQELQSTLGQLEKRHRQLKEAQNQLVQSEKMAGLGSLVAGVSHEINNPINFVQLGLYSLESDLVRQKEFLLELLEEETDIIKILHQQYSQIDGAIRDITEGSDRIKTIVKDLRTFSRLDEAECKSANIVENLQSTLRITQTQYKKNVQFQTDFQSRSELECRPAKLNQVFMNLIVNACQAIEKKQEENGEEQPGVLMIRTFEQGDIRDRWLAIQFEDNGCGMTEDVRQKIFEPFFTTKTVGEGTGMGMSITYGIIREHRGSIEVESESGEGTIITVYLPLQTTG